MTPDRWKSLVEHVLIHYEDRYWSNDSLYEKLVDEFIIQIGGESEPRWLYSCLKSQKTIPDYHYF